jgi:hypothetical protein
VPASAGCVPIAPAPLASTPGTRSGAGTVGSRPCRRSRTDRWASRGRPPGAVAASPVRDGTQVHHPVHGLVSDLRRKLVVGQVKRGEGGRVEGRAGCALAEVRRQAVAERRLPGAEAGVGRPNRAAPRSSTGSPRARATREELCDGSNEAASCTTRGKSSGPPRPGSSHTSSSRKSGAMSWIRQGREVCAVFGSLIGTTPRSRPPKRARPPQP